LSKILSLDTSTKVCSVAIHEDGHLIGSQVYHLQNSHSNLLPIIIDQTAKNCNIQLSELNAVALSSGPGSYTGLRIGTATIKGLAYTLGIPIVAINSLDTMIEQVYPFVGAEDVMLPMIDARRMEVYVKVMDGQRAERWDTRPLVVVDDSFEEFSGMKKYLFGNGSDKLKESFTDVSFVYIDNIAPSAISMGNLAYTKYQNQQFEDIAYYEPDYLKEFQTKAPTKKFKV